MSSYLCSLGLDGKRRRGGVAARRRRCSCTQPRATVADVGRLSSRLHARGSAAAELNRRGGEGHRLREGDKAADPPRRHRAGEYCLRSEAARYRSTRRARGGSRQASRQAQRPSEWEHRLRERGPRAAGLGAGIDLLARRCLGLDGDQGVAARKSQDVHHTPSRPRYELYKGQTRARSEGAEAARREGEGGMEKP